MGVTPQRSEWKGAGLYFPTDASKLLFGLLVFLFTIFLMHQHVLADPDTYWHVTTGKWILAGRSVPTHDVFSHSVSGCAWVDMEWLAQVILSEAYQLSGWRGLVLLCGMLISLTFVLLYGFLVRDLRATVAIGVSAVSFVFASPHFLARPHLLTFPIIVVWTACLARASNESRKPSLWLLPLMVLWANLHGGFTLGLLLAAGFGLDATFAGPST